MKIMQGRRRKRKKKTEKDIHLNRGRKIWKKDDDKDKKEGSEGRNTVCGYSVQMRKTEEKEEK
jgi:hypothetical protein